MGGPLQMLAKFKCLNIVAILRHLNFAECLLQNI